MSTQDKKRTGKTNHEDVFDREYPWDRPEKRLRFVDFQRIEDNRHEGVLTPYELEVKKEIACVPSPCDELVRQEDEAEKEREERSLKLKLAHLVRKANLSEKQKEFYRLLYVERISEKAVAKKLGVTRSRICQLKGEIESALKKTYQKSLEKSRPEKKPGCKPLTQKQRQVLKMHRDEGLPFEEIGRRLGISHAAAHRIFKRVQKNILYRGKG